MDKVKKKIKIEIEFPADFIPPEYFDSFECLRCPFYEYESECGEQELSWCGFFLTGEEESLLYSTRKCPIKKYF